MFNKSLIYIGILVFSVASFAQDIVSRQSIKAKVINVEIKKNQHGDEGVYITLEVNKELKSYEFSPFNGENLFYKTNLSPLPINKLKVGKIYNIEMGKFSTHNKNNELVDMIYYVGERPYLSGELE